MNTTSDPPQPWEDALEASARRPKRKVSRLQLAVYLAYEGKGELYKFRKRPDPDMFAGAWGTIESLLQQMGTAESGLASAKYRAAVEADLQQLTEDSATRDLFWAITLNRK
jgi:hypothetical protein